MSKSSILILDFLAIGDLLFMTPLLNTIRKNFPAVEINISVLEKLIPIVKYNEDIDNIIPFDKKGKHKPVSGYLDYIKNLRNTNPEQVITLQDNPRLALLAFLSGAPKRIGFAGNKSRALFYSNPVKPHDEQHRVEYYLDIARNLSEVDHLFNDGLKLNVSSKEKEWAAKKISKLYLKSKSQKIVGIHIGGKWPTKRWPPEKFASLADKLKEDGIEVVLLGGPDDISDANLVEYNMQHNILNLAGQTSLLELAALLDHFDLFIGGDTGPMHMSVARGTKTLAIFGPTEQWRYRPYGDKHEIIKLDLFCQPCHQKSCPYNWECMRYLQVKDVFEKSISIID